MPHEADPYTSLLGVRQGPRPPDHYALLGLERFTFEPPLIAEAADVQESKLKRLLGGEHAAIARRLLAEVAAARAVLLSAQRRAAYDATLRSGSTDTAEPHQTQEISVPDVRQRRASAASMARGRHRRQSAAGGLAAVAVSLAVLAGAAVYAFRDRLFAGAEPAAAPRVETIARSARAPASTFDDSPAGERRRYLDFADDATSAARPAANSKQPSPAKKQPSKRGKPKAKAAAEPQRLPPAARKSSGKSDAANSSAAIDVAALSGVAEQATASEQALVTRAVRAAIAAAGQRDLPRALEQADLAVLTASAADTMAEADRARIAVALLDEFWQAVEESIAALAPDMPLELAGRQLTVVETDEDGFSVRDGARTITYSVKNLRAEMALELASRSAKVDAERAALLTAAFHALDARGDRDEARRLAGASTAHEAAAILAIIEP